ncbi:MULTISPECIES: hypothetical protein [unclassified Fibrobacter]|uniref:hypothetical protein n=1 Tax=unclassified Fibrobacter TaxID=2634177 RepID=UPI000D6BAF7F|nr:MULTISPECIES: hypothetical protein [unclassified Fibrobacter]PWJ68532.1 hypothetical protein BGX12_10758 [Fibrobacter sp. UWR4]PZW72076.1 hypothetical protein C8E88_100848 [Fibrobacter sp. UWR1]
MNKILKNSLWASACVSAMVLSACGDSSSTSSNVEKGDGSSSSVESSSSVAEEVSSSSVSDIDVPEGGRVATLADLEKNISLGEMFGTKAYLATGAKHDVYSIWVPDTAWMGFFSEFKDGTITFGGNNGYYAGIDGDKVTDAMGEFWKKGGTISFIVNSEDKLQFSVNGGDFQDAVSEKVPVSKNAISNGDDLKGLKLECKNGDDKVTYTFYEGRFLQESEGEDGLEWAAGYYDIQRSKLLMMQTFFNTKGYVPLTNMTVDSDYNLTSVTGATYSCSKSNFKFESIDADKIAGEWVADGDGLDWTMNLKKNGDYSVEAKKAGNTEELKAGSWDIYGDLLVLKNKQCLNPSKCVNAAKGVVSHFDAESGFDFDHSDTGTPAVPKTWTVQQYE